MSFIIYDLSFLVIFALAMIIFLVVNRRKVKFENIFMILYRTSVGMKMIDALATKHKKTLKWLSWIIVSFGYILMGFSIYLIYNLIIIFLKPGMIDVIRIPPLAPLIPYLPAIFKVTWLPPFYASYWIIILILVAIFHEGAHGVLARYNKVKIKSTGFGFFWPLLSPLFFVEQDDKNMEKRKIFAQLSIIAAGVFANLVLAILFFFLMAGFFSAAYAPSGVIFNDYSYGAISASAILSGIPINQTLAVDGTNFTKMKINGSDYFIADEFFKLKENISKEAAIKGYYDLPAIKAKLFGAITKVGTYDISNKEDIPEVLANFKPGDEVVIKTVAESNGYKNISEYTLNLGADYANNSRAVIGITASRMQVSGFKGIIYRISNIFKDPNTYYSPKSLDNLTKFIYYLLQWLFLINLSIALANMIPAGIFDGGRFFYLTILMITRKKKLAEKLFKISTMLFIGILIFLTLIWAKWFIMLFFK